MKQASKKSKFYVMTPSHKNWGEFCNRLGGPEGCEQGCSSDSSRPFATRILQDMGADVVKSLNYFSKHGGYCDCEILFNVITQEQMEIRRKMQAEYHAKKRAESGTD